MIPEWTLYPAVLLILVGAGFYIRNILRGTARPNLVTWFLWALAPLIAFAAQVSEGVGAPAALTFMVGFGPLLVFAVGLKKGNFKPTIFDWWCGAAALMALTLWQLAGSGLVAVSLGILADALGAAPTLKKSFYHPRSESPLFFALFAVSAGGTLLAIQEWSIQTAAFPLYIFILYVTLYCLVKYKIGVRLQKQFGTSRAEESEG